MDKRTFLRISSAFTMASLLSPLKNFAQKERLKNWAGNLEYSASDVRNPKTVEEVQSLVTQFEKVKALGTRHCFNDIADSKHHLVSTIGLNKPISVNLDNTVTIEGGMNYGQLCPYLEEKGLALHNLASLPHISVAGACATATHGSGVANGNLSTAVEAIEFIKADGSLIELSRTKDKDKFLGAVVNLGALGIVTKIKLKVMPTYPMRQFVFERLPLVQLKGNFDEIMSAGYSVSLFTDWSQESVNEVWVKDLTRGKMKSRQSEFFGAHAASKNLHPIASLSAENCTEQMGLPGSWYERLPHFKMGFTPSSGKELQAEYFVPRKSGWDAFQAIQKMGKEITPHLFISEIRSIAADELWMSPCYKQDSIAIHFTWKQDWTAVSNLLPKIERALSDFGVKPHWGKLFTIPAATLASCYPKMNDFKNLANEFDPTGKFRNDFLMKNIFA